MKHLTMLLPEEQTTSTTVACIVGTYEMFIEANAYNNKHNHKEAFSIELAGISQKRDFSSGMLTLKPHRNISEIAKTDLIIIPSVALEYEKTMTENRKLIEWIKKQYEQGAEVASMCTGAYLLASTGLLDGKNCSTHWQATNNFKTLYPQVNLKTDQLITDENGIYTN
jgi:transcriptional regulator GlxA family with amidase domain